jgi:hypothetical protein
MENSVVFVLMVTGLAVLAATAGRLLIAIRKQSSLVKIPVRVRSQKTWKE